MQHRTLSPIGKRCYNHAPQGSIAATAGLAHFFAPTAIPKFCFRLILGTRDMTAASFARRHVPPALSLQLPVMAEAACVCLPGTRETPHASRDPTSTCK